MKVWITAKMHVRGHAWVHGLTEEYQQIRLMQPNGSYPSTRTVFDVGQVWDLTFEPAPRRIVPHIEDVVVTRWKQYASEQDLRAVLAEHVSPWQGRLDQLFTSSFRTVINNDKAFLSEGDSLPSQSMGYWLVDVPLIKWHHKSDGRLCYRYWTPTKVIFLDYISFAQPISQIPEQTLVHVTLSPWWTPSNTFAVDESSRVKRRCYLCIAGWYL